MIDRVRSLGAMVLAVVTLGTIGCDEKTSYCDNLRSVVASEQVQSYLRDWVARYIIEMPVARDDLVPAGGMWPGFYFLKSTGFDWSVLRFGPHSQIRLVGLVDIEDLADVTGPVTSVYFGERTRQGVLVRIPGSREFGVDNKFLIPIAADIAIVCRE